jgi:ubiquinone/menaquinone biosynthesis C-methylase UbiE
MLPDTTFDKVLLIDTYHHFQNRDEMIRDVFRILKPGGKLIVNEPVGGKPGVIYKPCNSLIETPDELISYIRERGFELERMFDNGRSGGEKVKVFVFGRW